ncbi:MAG TPA: GAF domain-containing protein [Candidatus Lustribacter sp.]|nr:GAF domain-containing protein [Candidatus Lustribacter sp.]
MKVRFWGTRGSIAKPGPSTARYGGNTSCIEVRSSQGTLVVIDCGTGSHGLGQALVAEGTTRGCLLIGHTHWDHIQGLPFFAPLFEPDNEWDICGPKGLSGSLRETLAGQMESTYFPVALESLGATIRYWDLLQGSFQVDDIRVSTHHLNHPALTLAYRLEADGASIVYACDHEMYSHPAADGNIRLDGPDLRHAEFAAGADLLIHDAQYTAAEYPAKVNWGHSTIEYAMRVAREAGVAQLALTHHDPLRTDDDLDQLLERARATMLEYGSPVHVFAAAEGMTLDVNRSAPQAVAALATGIAERSIDTTENVQTVLLALHDPELMKLFGTAIADDASLRAVTVTTVDEVHAAAVNDRLSVCILEHGSGQDALALARRIAEDRVEDRRRMPVLVVSDREYPGGDKAGIAEWLVRPFSNGYAQAKVQAWVHRGISRWKKAPIPPDEDRRLTTLRAMDILDTPPESRFDRITRLASRFFAAPIALITLVDRDRQWFKSRIGLIIKETSREMSFAAHVVAERTTLVVNDALVDDRFAENPLVVGEPRVRFYAGAPLIMQDGTCLGAVSVMDTRPRWFAASDVQLLEDLRDLAVSEIERERTTGAGPAADSRLA